MRVSILGNMRVNEMRMKSATVMARRLYPMVTLMKASMIKASAKGLELTASRMAQNTQGDTTEERNMDRVHFGIPTGPDMKVVGWKTTGTAMESTITSMVTPTRGTGTKTKGTAKAFTLITPPVPSTRGPGCKAKGKVMVS